MDRVQMGLSSSVFCIEREQHGFSVGLGSIVTSYFCSTDRKGWWGRLLQSSSDCFLDHHAQIVILITKPDYYLQNNAPNIINRISLGQF